MTSQLYPIGRAIPFFDLWNDKSLQKSTKISPFLYTFLKIKAKKIRDRLGYFGEQIYPIGRTLSFFDRWNDKSLQKVLKISSFCQDFEFLKSKIS